jgi:hypothetical protein
MYVVHFNPPPVPPRQPQWQAPPPLPPSPPSAFPPAPFGPQPGRRQPPSRFGRWLRGVRDFVGIMVAILIVSVVAWRTMGESVRVPSKPRPVPVVQPKPLEVARGQGEAVGQVVPGVRPEEPAPTRPAPRPVVDVEALIAESIQKARAAAFDEADFLAQQALQHDPQNRRARGARALAAYGRQYGDLADRAFAAMNGAVEIDFGRRHGMAAFIEKDAERQTYTFRCNGRNTEFTLAQLKSMDGVRFRITERWLDAARNPVNDLILGSTHYLKRLRKDGTQGAPGNAPCVECTDAARKRWDRARLEPGANRDVSEHAEWLITLLD